MQDTRRCLNCGEIGSGNYCHHCGQKYALTKIQFKEIISEFLGTVFNIDSPFPITIKRLFVNPGKLINEFLSGQRKRFYAPIRYLLLCLFLNILIGEMLGFDPIANQQAMDPRPEAVDQNTGYQVGRFLSNHLNFFTLLFPFCMAMISRLMYWRVGYNLAERTVFGFYIAGQYIILSLIPILLSKLSPFLFLLNYLFTIAYLTYGFFSFHQINSKFWRLLKAIIAAIISIIVFYAASFISAYWIMKIMGEI